MEKGYGVSPGIAIGTVVIKNDFEYEIKDTEVNDIEKEVSRLKNAIKKCKHATNELYERMLKNSGKKEAQIFKAHLLLLEDPELVNKVINEIKNTHKNAPYCLEKIVNKFIIMFNNMDNAYLKERALDLKDIKERLMKVLFNYENPETLDMNNQVIIAKELTPSDTAKLDLKKVVGFITETGGKTSHTAIMAKSLELPAIVGVRSIVEKVKSGDKIVIDGAEGNIYINPDEKFIAKYTNKRAKYKEYREMLNSLKGKNTTTKDNVKVELAANIGTLNDIEGVLSNDAEGIGLFRTEFLYMNSNDFPTEKEQFNVYKKVAVKMGNRPVIIRTFDIGGDKELPYYDFPQEMNPFLGYRAIRMCLDNKELFKTQLRAILRASVYGKIKIMFPMISTVRELIKVKEILDSTKLELDEEGILYDKNIEVGMMIEVPSAAIISDSLAKYVDFFSIGTNDLIQYTLAVDRMNENIKELYDSYNPAILRLINTVIKNGHKKDIWVGMCGEVAGNLKLIPLLLGMGLDEFSMSSINILPARNLMINLNKSAIEPYVERVLDAETSEEVKVIIEEMIEILELEKFYKIE